MKMQSFRFLLFLFFLFSLKLQAQVCNIGQLPNGLRIGLVAYFPFCGNTNDISGINNVGNANNITFQTDRFGNANSTASFNKANQSHIAFLNNQNFQQTSFTLSTWFNTNTISTGALGSGNDQFIAGHSPTQWLIGPSYEMTLDVVDNADIFSRMWTPATSWQDINAPRGLIRANTWYHAVLVYDGVAKIQRFYLNGNLIGQRQTELSYFGQAGFFIGGSLQNAAGTIGTLFNGLIDDVGFWNRPLTDCEIQQLYTVNNSGFTNNQIIGFNPLPDSLSFCGQNAVINGPNGFSSYTWDNGASNQNISVNRSGLYKLIVSDQQGCLGLDSVQISIIDATIIQNDTTICNNSDSLTLSINPNIITNSGCTGNPTVIFSDWTQISPNGNFLNIIKNAGKYYMRSMTDVFETTSISGTYTSLGFNTQIGNNSAGSLLGIDNIGRIHVSTSHASLYVLNGATWSPNGLAGFGTAGQYFVKLSSGRIVLAKAGFLRDIYYSDDNGTTWINATNIDVDWNHITLASNGFLFAGSAIGGVSTKGLLRSIDNGTSWQNISAQLSISGVTGISKSCTGDLYVAADLKLFKSTNNGLDWLQIGNLPSFFQANPNYGKLLIASNGEIFYYGYIDANRVGLFSSKDGGQTWNVIQIPSGTFNEMQEIDSQIILLTTSGIYAKTLLANSIVQWSTGQTTNSIRIKPSISTKYFVSVKNGLVECIDSIQVNVNSLIDFNPLLDTIKLCGTSIKLDAGTKYSNYTWSNGEITPSIQANIGGRYFVTVKDSLGCTASDSTYLSLVNANILQNDTTVCNGGSINLSVDTVYKVINTFGTSLPTNLKNDLVAYYPFNGNANDESGNGNHAAVYNARLTTDRFGRANSAYSFSPTDRSSIIPGILNTSMVNSFTYSVWVKPLNTIVVPAQGQAANAASGFPNNTCVIHPIHGQNYGPPTLNTGTGVYVGTNGVYLEEHSDGWEAVPISHQMDLTGWHLINIVYENKVPTLYIDGVFIKKGIPSARQIYASLGPDKYPSYERSGIGAGYIPTRGTLQYFNGDIDDIFFYKRALNANEVSQIFNGALSIKWSTGDTTSKITVSPSSTTKYFVTVSDGITTCTDSVLVKVNNLSDFNPLPDTISQCGKSITLDAGGDFQTYSWSSAATTKSILVTQGGRYSVSVKTAEGCTATDTTVVSLVYVNIENRDTIVCAPTNIKLQLIDTLLSKKGGWELLIPSSSFNFSETNFREGGFDAENAKLYSVLKNGSVNRFYVFDLNTNSVQTLESNSPPSEVYDYVYDFTNSRIIGTRVGRDRMFSIPLTGGTWTPYGNGNFDAESYGCATYWNPISRRPGFFGGYGFFSVKNWVWENNGNAGWQNVFANTNNCQPPKRTGQIARNKQGDKLFIFSGQGSCDGNQRASSCSLSQPWATDVGIFCWLKDLWELDLTTYTFKNILPPNSPSIINEGGFAYDYNSDVFYNVGGYKPLSTYSPSNASNLNYDVEVYRYRRGVDNGFELMPIDGVKPPILKLSQYSGRTYFDAKNNRIIWARNDGIWALNLGATGSVSYKYKWSTGDSTTSIIVSPTKTTTYYVNVTDGITTCVDSVTITVEQPKMGIRYPTQDIIVNRPTEVAARNFGKTYLWNPDVQLNSPRLNIPIITPTKQQQYTVRITTDGGCVTVDTVLVRVFPDRNIYVPEGFTPDSDGRNDRLYPIPVGIREMRTFRIYNRWGKLLYDNKNANINNGWDGTHLGTAQPMESYVWIAEGIDIDGKFIRRTGNTILIR